MFGGGFGDEDDTFTGSGMPGVSFSFGGNMPGMRGGFPGGQMPTRQRGPVKAEPIRQSLPCSLEELYTGTTKKFKITRQKLNADGKSTRPEEKIIEIPIRAGYKKGTTITFPNEGDEGPGIIPADLIFTLTEKPHDRFVREGNHLVHTARITLEDALCGTKLSVRTLDGRTLSVPVNEVISPGYLKTVPGEGMPISKSPGSKGDLLIKFNVVFPSYIPESKKTQLRSLLKA